MTTTIDPTDHTIVIDGKDTGQKPEDYSKSASNEALASQVALAAEALRLNTAMAWLQMSLGISGKIAGR